MASKLFNLSRRSKIGNQIDDRAVEEDVREASARDSTVQQDWGLKTLSEPKSPQIDIVAIHGLNGHRERTWTVDGQLWLRDFLPEKIPSARILTWGYDANTHSREHISRQYIYDHGTTLISDLCLERALTKTHRLPIIFVVHSLGGVILKSALIHSDLTRRGHLEQHRSIAISTYGIIFAGTPHQGGEGVLLGKRLINIASLFVNTNANLLRHLERDSEFLQHEIGQFAAISDQFVTKFAFETYETSLAAGKAITVVPKASAVVPGTRNAEAVSIPKDHISMVKASSRDDVAYRTYSGHLVLMSEEADQVIAARWEQHDRSQASAVNLPNRLSASKSQPNRATTVFDFAAPAISGPSSRGTNTETLSTHQGSPEVGMTMLHRAVLGGAIKFAKDLIDKGADPNACCTVNIDHSYTPLHFAAYQGNEQLVGLLLDHGANKDAQTDSGYTALNIAARASKKDIVRQLLNHSASVDLANDSNETPLMSSVESGDVEIVQMLLDVGADPSVQQTPGGWTTLHKAVGRHQTSVVEELLVRFSEPQIVEAASVTGARPLHVAVRQGYSDLVGMLLNAGADPDVVDKSGITPLRVAIQHREQNYLSVARILVDAGARTDLIGSDGVSLFDIARLNEDEEMIAYLEEITQNSHFQR